MKLERYLSYNYIITISFLNDDIKYKQFNQLIIYKR